MPKGRRNNYEDSVQCALREFQEETSYENTEYELLKDINEYTEIFNGYAQWVTHLYKDVKNEENLYR